MGNEGIKAAYLPGFTPLHMAVFLGNREAVELLRNHSATCETPKEGISIYKIAVAMGQTALLPQEMQQKYLALKKDIEMIKPLLEAYQTARRQRFAIKDRITAQDKIDRETFISDLCDECHFLTDGKNDLIKKIHEGIAKYPGDHFQTTLQQCLLKLMGDDTPEKNCYTQAQDILFKKQSSAPAYVASVKKLYTKIQAMTAYASQLPEAEITVIKNLAGQLQQDLSMFICQPANQASFERFQLKFHASLHSQDVVMGQQETWNSFAWNLFLGVISMGTALGIKAICSKVSTGVCTLFARETHKQQLRNEIQQAMEEVRIF